MLTVAPLATAKTWKQPTSQQMNKDVVHLYSATLLNHKKKMK